MSRRPGRHGRRTHGCTGIFSHQRPKLGIGSTAYIQTGDCLFLMLASRINQNTQRRPDAMTATVLAN
jgi:hypothetical protein